MKMASGFYVALWRASWGAFCNPAVLVRVPQRQRNGRCSSQPALRVTGKRGRLEAKDIAHSIQANECGHIIFGGPASPAAKRPRSVRFAVGAPSTLAVAAQEPVAQPVTFAPEASSMLLVDGPCVASTLVGLAALPRAVRPTNCPASRLVSMPSPWHGHSTGAAAQATPLASLAATAHVSASAAVGYVSALAASMATTACLLRGTVAAMPRRRHRLVAAAFPLAAATADAYQLATGVAPHSRDGAPDLLKLLAHCSTGHLLAAPGVPETPTAKPVRGDSARSPVAGDASALLQALDGAGGAALLAGCVSRLAAEPPARPTVMYVDVALQPTEGMELAAKAHSMSVQAGRGDWDEWRAMQADQVAVARLLTHLRDGGVRGVVWQPRWRREQGDGPLCPSPAHVSGEALRSLEAARAGTIAHPRVVAKRPPGASLHRFASVQAMAATWLSSRCGGTLAQESSSKLAKEERWWRAALGVPDAPQVHCIHAPQSVVEPAAGSASDATVLLQWTAGTAKRSSVLPYALVQFYARRTLLRALTFPNTQLCLAPEVGAAASLDLAQHGDVSHKM